MSTEFIPLFKVPKESWVETEDGHRFFFDHLDGMYSYCNEIGGGISHYSCGIKVKPVEGPK